MTATANSHCSLFPHLEITSAEQLLDRPFDLNTNAHRPSVCSATADALHQNRARFLPTFEAKAQAKTEPINKTKHANPVALRQERTWSMTTNNHIPIPPSWRQCDAYLVINFLQNIIGAIRQTHGAYLAAQTPEVTAIMLSAPLPTTPRETFEPTPNTNSNPDHPR